MDPSRLVVPAIFPVIRVMACFGKKSALCWKLGLFVQLLHNMTFLSCFL
jgi:hypothetical protein